MGIYVTGHTIYGTVLYPDNTEPDLLRDFLKRVGLETPADVPDSYYLDTSKYETWEDMEEERGDLWEVFYGWVEYDSALDVAYGGEEGYTYPVVGYLRSTHFETLWEPLELEDLPPVNLPEAQQSALDLVRDAFRDSSTSPTWLFVVSRR